jgi:hypothetical protein
LGRYINIGILNGHIPGRNSLKKKKVVDKKILWGMLVFGLVLAGCGGGATTGTGG